MSDGDITCNRCDSTGPRRVAAAYPVTPFAPADWTRPVIDPRDRKHPEEGPLRPFPWSDPETPGYMVTPGCQARIRAGYAIHRLSDHWPGGRGAV